MPETIRDDVALAYIGFYSRYGYSHFFRSHPRTMEGMRKERPSSAYTYARWADNIIGALEDRGLTIVRIPESERDTYRGVF
jgi:hypothetical protein